MLVALLILSVAAVVLAALWAAGCFAYPRTEEQPGSGAPSDNGGEATEMSTWDLCNGSKGRAQRRFVLPL